MPKAVTVDPILRLVNPVREALNHMSYSEIARRSGTTFGFISLLFRGYRSAKVSTLERIAGALRVSLEELVAYLKTVPKRGQKHGWGQTKGRAGEAA